MGHGGGPVDRDGDILDQRAGQLGHAVVVGVGLVGLQHGEFRRMGGIDALVAEVAVDLEDPLDSADGGALEVELRGNAQVELHVKRIHVRGERPRGRPAVQHLQHRSFDLEKTTVVQRGPQRPIDRGPDLHGSARLGPDDQIDIALTDARLFRQWLVRDRQRPQRLRGNRPGIGQNRQLTASRRDDPTVREQVVAQIHVPLECGERFLTHAGQGHHDLHFGTGLARSALAHRGKAQLPRVTQEDDPAGDPDGFPGVGVRRQIRETPAQIRQIRGARHGDRVGLDALIEQPLPLLAAYPHLLRQILVAQGGR